MLPSSGRLARTNPHLRCTSWLTTAIDQSKSRSLNVNIVFLDESSFSLLFWFLLLLSLG